MTWLSKLARPDIVALEPYRYAAWQPGFARLNANETPWRAPGDGSGAGLNRYPEPQSRALIERLAALYRAAPETLLVCRGSDEGIDLLVRAFCRANQDAVLICPPTFGMYAVAARIQGARVREVPLAADRGFALDADAVLEACTREVKLVFLCSPNNPTGNLLDPDSILTVAKELAGRALVVLDQAYVEFAPSAAADVLPRPVNLVVLRTLSKAHGLAGARLGTLIADPEVIALLRKVLTPYAVPQLVLEAVAAVLSPPHLRTLPRRIAEICAERSRLQEALAALPGVRAVLPSEANFLMVRFDDAGSRLAQSLAARLLVRDARAYPGLEDALRITIGTAEQNDALLRAWA